jgi:hypothetical protein
MLPVQSRNRTPTAMRRATVSPSGPSSSWGICTRGYAQRARGVAASGGVSSFVVRRTVPDARGNARRAQNRRDAATDTSVRGVRSGRDYLRGLCRPFARPLFKRGGTGELDAMLARSIAERAQPSGTLRTRLRCAIRHELALPHPSDVVRDARGRTRRVFLDDVLSAIAHLVLAPPSVGADEGPAHRHDHLTQRRR